MARIMSARRRSSACGSGVWASVAPNALRLLISSASVWVFSDSPSMRAATCADIVLNACARLPISSRRCVGSSCLRSPWAIAVAAAASLRSGLLIVWATIAPMATAMSSATRNAPMVIALISPSAAAKASRRTDTLSCATVWPCLSRSGTSWLV